MFSYISLSGIWLLSAMGVQDPFHLGGLRSGQWPEYFLHCLPEYQVILPEYDVIFCPNMAIFTILGGLQPPATPPPPASYAYEDSVGNWTE